MSNIENKYRYTAELANEIEKKQQERWRNEHTFYAANPVGLTDKDGKNSKELGKEPYFIMDMFPYPSGAGLHVGHPLGYIATDVVGRYQRMNNKNVLHALGFDAFGLPAEQYAIQTGEHPESITKKNMANMKRQTSQIGLAHDDRRSFATIDTEYIKWTQWIFLQIFNSYYDEEYVKPNGDVGSARPIEELVKKYETGQKEVPGGRNWQDLTEKEKNDILQLSRLAYTKSSPVNWVPGLGTVLANEEVTNEGKSERGNFPVFKKDLKQWFMRITAYAERLIKGLDTIDWPEQIKSMQRHWIGKSEGVLIDFEISENSKGRSPHKNNRTVDISDIDLKPLEVFTTRCDTLFGASYLAVAPEHPLLEKTYDRLDDNVKEYITVSKQKKAVDRMIHSTDKTGEFTGLYAINPVNDEPLPIFVADYVLMDYGTGAIMAVPGGDQRDYDFAKAFDLPVTYTVCPKGKTEQDLIDSGEAYTEDGIIINSASDKFDLNGLSVDEAKKVAEKWFVENGVGKPQTNYKIRDWLFSRQRYWGEPFPIVYDEDGSAKALPEDMLPLELPKVPDYAPKTYDPYDEDSEPETPLSKDEAWVNVDLDLGDGVKHYKRETNTMPNWAGSSWYYLRYVDPTNNEKMIDPVNDEYWLGANENRGKSGGVDLYIGGKEHAVLHLLYARFWHMVLFDLGIVSSPEPFHKLFNQGYIQAYAYTNKYGTYVPAAEVEERQRKEGNKVVTEYFYKGEKVNREYGKMGKSLKNVVTPDEVYNSYGADTFRVYEMSMGPLDMSKPWDTRSIIGSMRFLQKVWRNFIDENTGESIVSKDKSESNLDTETRRLLHGTIDSVRTEIEGMRPNTAIAKLITLNNKFVGMKEIPQSVAEKFVIMLSPFAPHIAEEIWQRMGHEDTITYESFPVADPEFLVEDTTEAIVQVNGKLRAKLQVPVSVTNEELEKTALNDDKVKSVLAETGGEIRKTIVKAPKLVSIVVK